MPKIQFDDYLGKGLITLGAVNAQSKERLRATFFAKMFRSTGQPSQFKP